MKPSRTEKLIPLLRKGIDDGFGEHHIIEQLLKRGYKQNEIDYALLVLKNPDLEKEMEVSKEEIEMSEKKAKLHPYDEVVNTQKIQEKPKPFEALREPAVVYLVLTLCVLFFILGMVAGKLILS